MNIRYPIYEGVYRILTVVIPYCPCRKTNSRVLFLYTPPLYGSVWIFFLNHLFNLEQPFFG